MDGPLDLVDYFKDFNLSYQYTSNYVVFEYVVVHRNVISCQLRTCAPCSSLLRENWKFGKFGTIRDENISFVLKFEYYIHLPNHDELFCSTIILAQLVITYAMLFRHSQQ